MEAVREAEENSRKRVLSFSSEAPYRRCFGMEILDHGEGAADLGRLNGSGVLLFNHDVDQVLGKVLRAWVENGKGYAEVEFDTDEEAERIFAKVKSRTLKTTSVRYQVDSWEEVRAGAVSADGRFTGPCRIARRWTPLEVSIVSVPADASVGVGRSEEGTPYFSLYERQVQININTGGRAMKDKWIKRQLAILARAKAEGRNLTAEEQAEFDECQRKIDAEPDVSGEGRDGQRGIGGLPAGSAVVSNAAPVLSQPQTSEAFAAGEADKGSVRSLPRQGETELSGLLDAERKRAADIMALCRQTGMEPEQYIKNGDSLDTVRAAAVEYLVQNRGPVIVGARDSGTDNFRDAARDALLMQAGVDVDKPAQGAEDYRGMSLRDMLIESLARSGEGTTTELLRRSRNDLWDTAVRQFLSPTADFPAILDNAINKSLVQQYQLVPATFELWTSKGSLTDFKESKAHEYALGGGDFYKVGEGGELKHSTLQTELLPTRKLESYGTQFTMTREAFINDDIGFLAAMPAQYASRAKRQINRQVYEKIYQNPAEFDGAPLFDAAHKNLISDGSAPSISVMEKMIQMMGMQVDQFGESITVEPAAVIVPVGWGMRVSQLLGTAEIDVEGIGSHAVNVLNTEWRSRIKIVQEGALNVLAKDGPCPWFMAADPRLVKGIQVDYLNNVTTPSFRRSEKAGYLGFVWDIWLDWAVNVMDFRGLLRNNGAKISL